MKTNLDCITGLEKHNPSYVHEAIHRATDGPVNWAVHRAVGTAVYQAVDRVVFRTTWRASHDDPVHQARYDFLFDVRAVHTKGTLPPPRSSNRHG